MIAGRGRFYIDARMLIVTEQKTTYSGIALYIREAETLNV